MFIINKHLNGLLAACACAICLSSCSRTPDGVLNQEEMASLMADIHMGEAVIDYNYSTFPNDSTRKMLKQSIYLAHGVDQEIVDTSFVWYGNHIEDYIKVYDRTIEIIQDRQRDYVNASNSQITIAGDSVEVWNGPRHVIVNNNIPTTLITFNVRPDSTWQNGDVYMLSYKLINSTNPVKGKLLVDYSDGSTSFVDQAVSEHSKNLLRIQVDSTLTPLRVYGYINLPVNRQSYYEVDSIALTRMRKRLFDRSFMINNVFRNGIKPQEKRLYDETENDSDIDDNTTTTQLSSSYVANKATHTERILPHNKAGNNTGIIQRQKTTKQTL